MERYLFVSVVGFALGISAHVFLLLSWVHIGYVVLLAAVLLILFLWKRTPLYLLGMLLLLGGVLGMARTEILPQALPQSFEQEGEKTIEGIVVAEPDIRETTQRLTVEIQEEARVKILVVAPLYPPVRYGETVRATGILKAPEPFETQGGRSFAYDAFLKKDGIFVIMESETIEVVSPRQGVAHMRGSLSDIKFSSIKALSAALPEPQASLASGLILGGKQGLGSVLLDDFIRSGLVHIVVLSGYNVMIVADFIMRVFGFLKGGWSAGIGAVSIALFVLAAGAGPASIRAGIMAAIALYGRATGRTYDAFRALMAAGLLMLLVNPLTLPYDPGFQLSFIATLGLIFGAPIVATKLMFIRSGFLREILSSTIAAQVAVLPLLLYQSGLFSIVALPANLLVLPLVPFAMLASFLSMLAGWLVPFAAPTLGLPAYVLLSYMIGVVEIASDLPLAAISIPAFPFVVVVGAYAALFFLYRSLKHPLLNNAPVKV